MVSLLGYIFHFVSGKYKSEDSKYLHCNLYVVQYEVNHMHDKADKDKHTNHNDDVNVADIASTLNQFCNDNRNKYNTNNKRMKIDSNVSSKCSIENSNNN